MFDELSKIEAGHVSFGDASKVMVKGRGTICFSQKIDELGQFGMCTTYSTSKPTYSRPINPVTNKVLVSRDVVINEENEWNNSIVTVKSLTMTSENS